MAIWFKLAIAANLIYWTVFFLLLSRRRWTRRRIDGRHFPHAFRRPRVGRSYSLYPRAAIHELWSRLCSSERTRGSSSSSTAPLLGLVSGMNCGG